MSSSSGASQLFVRKNNLITELNFKPAFDAATVKAIKEATGVKRVTVGDGSVPNYKHLVLRTVSETERRKNAITIKRIDVEEGIKYDENVRTVWPEKFKDTILRAWLEDGEENNSAEQFKKAVEDPKVVKGIEKRCFYKPSDIKFEPMEARVDGRSRVTYIHDAAYYSPLANILANRRPGDKVYMAGWTVGYGEYFGELCVKPSEYLDAFGRECAEWIIKGEDKAKYHPIWDVKPGLHELEVLPAKSGDNVDAYNSMVEPGRVVYCDVQRYLPGDGALDGRHPMFATFVVTVLSDEDWRKCKADRPGEFDLEAAMAKAKSRLIIYGDLSRSVTPVSDVSIEEAVPVRAPEAKRMPWTVGQIAAQVDVDYKDPRVTSARANQLVLQEYPGIEIGDKSDKVEEVMRLICAEMYKRKSLRDGLTEAVLREWEAYSTPSSNPAQGATTRATAWAHGTVKAVAGAVADKVSDAAAITGSAYRSQFAKAFAGGLGGFLAAFAIIILMSFGVLGAFAVVAFTLGATVRVILRVFAWFRLIFVAVSGLAALGVAPGAGFLDQAKDAAAHMGALTGAVIGAAAKNV